MAKKSRHYPFIDLRESVQLARAIYDQVHYSFIPYDVLIESWGYSPTGSTGLRKLAALNRFGLVDEEGSKESRKVALSDLGKAIVLGKELENDEYWSALQEAALNPSVYREIWENFDGRLPPSDRVLKHHLLSVLEFNPKSVDSFLEDFHATLEFARLEGNGVSSDQEPDLFGKGDSPDESEKSEARPHQPPKERQRDSVGGLNMSANDPSIQVIPIPLFNGQFATLNVPKGLTQKDYTHLKQLVQTMLEGMEGLLVEGENQNANREAENSVA